MVAFLVADKCMELLVSALLTGTSMAVRRGGCHGWIDPLGPALLSQFLLFSYFPIYSCVFWMSKTPLTYRISCSYFNGLVQERCNSSAIAMEVHLSCTKPINMSQQNPKLWYTCQQHLFCSRSSLTTWSQHGGLSCCWQVYGVIGFSSAYRDLNGC